MPQSDWPYSGAEKQPLGTEPSRLTFRSMFMHAWDLADDGADAVMEEARAAGLNTLCLAGTYHSGWFIHPQNKHHRAFMTEGSVCYFHPHDALYEKTRLRPQVSALCRQRDWFGEAGKRLKRYDLRLVSWTIGAHSTRLGLKYPELTLQNVYGDHLPHALCPAQKEVREYLKAVCRDLAIHYPVSGLQLESFGWMGLVHGHHHERDLVGLSPLEQELMAFCFCPACVEGAGLAGVDIAKVKTVVQGTLDAAFREAPQRPAHHPQNLAEMEAATPELKKFTAWRKQVTDSLIKEIKAESLKGTACHLLLQTPFDPALATASDGFACGAYQKTPDEVSQVCREAVQSVLPSWKGLFQCFIQLGMGVPQSEAQLRGIIAAVQNARCNGINFYNRSESPPKMLGWLARVLPEFRS